MALVLDPSSLYTTMIFITVVWLALYVMRRRRVMSTKCSAPLPPGPPGLPLLGNILDMPRKDPWRTFTEWKDRYGDVVYLEVFGRPIILLLTAEATADLFESRFQTYSNRPTFPLMDLVGHQWNFGFMNYGPKWRTHRRLFGETYGTSKSLQTFYQLQYRSTGLFLANMLRDPEAYSKHLWLKNGQLIMDVTYGILPDSDQHPFVHTAARVMDVSSLALSPVMWLMNPVRLIDYIPTWLGGAHLASTLRQWRKDLEDLRHLPFKAVKQALMEGKAKPCYVASLLQEVSPEEGSAEEEDIRDTAAIAFAGALDTTLSNNETLILAMMHYPEVQKRAQKEIDEVVGGDRLPDFSDRARLPYVSAVVKEALRFHPPAPTGIPHLAQEEDEYKGMRIPKGSVIMGNIWGICHDPYIYKDPDTFNPDRYIRDGLLDAGTIDPTRYVFGYGRRVCPGKFFAEDTLWIFVAQFLAVFDVLPPDGAKLPASPEYESGAISRPVPFKCIIRPRSEGAKHLIECAAQD